MLRGGSIINMPKNLLQGIHTLEMVVMLYHKCLQCQQRSVMFLLFRSPRIHKPDISCFMITGCLVNPFDIGPANEDL